MELKRKVYETKEEKRRDFALGTAGWIGINVAVLVVGQLLHAVGLTLNWVGIWGIVVLVVNVGALIFLGFIRPWMALGALATFGAGLLVASCFVGGCFLLLQGLE